MTIKEFIKQYNLERSNKIDRKEFIADFTNEFISHIESDKFASESLSAFNGIINIMKQKFDALDRKTIYGLDEGIWRYWYAAIACKIREEYFPEEKKYREFKEAEWKAKKAEERAEKERWQKIIDDQQASWEAEFEARKAAYSAWLSALLRINTKPVSSFETLELNEDATAEDVRKAYKELALKHHPDKGGNQQRFIEITEAKNKCLAYLN
jgi:hypothetical protein